MNEAQLYEKIGRLQTALEQLNGEYDKLLAVFQKSVSGELGLNALVVDLANRSWQLIPMTPPAPAAAEPETPAEGASPQA